jgi:GH18 family chitinase
MTYDFHGQWDKKTGHIAPIYHIPGDDNDFFNVVSARRGCILLLYCT